MTRERFTDRYFLWATIVCLLTLIGWIIFLHVLTQTPHHAHTPDAMGVVP